MKNALILHGTSSNPHANWFDWTKEKLEFSNFKVWVPQLPQADHPDMVTYKDYIFRQGWDFNSDSVIIGHSSGAVAVLSLLEALPEGKNHRNWAVVEHRRRKCLDTAWSTAGAQWPRGWSGFG